MFVVFVFFKQKTAYEMRISDWSSDVCSSDLHERVHGALGSLAAIFASEPLQCERGCSDDRYDFSATRIDDHNFVDPEAGLFLIYYGGLCLSDDWGDHAVGGTVDPRRRRWRSEEHTSELQSLMRISYAVLCLKKKTRTRNTR